MSHILFLRLAGPMQSWGTSSRFSHRETGKEPSKSGVIGLLCAAMGIDREQANTDNPVFKKMTEMEMGVRVLREGVLQSDYHTASNIAKADGGTKDTELSTRFYLSDADFVVALRSDDAEFLASIRSALQRPKWQLFLGRKAFVPHLPVLFSDAETVVGDSANIATALSEDLNAALLADEAFFDFRSSRSGESTTLKQRLILEDEKHGTEIRQDVPISFAERRFGMRCVLTDFVELNTGGEQYGIVS